MALLGGLLFGVAWLVWQLASKVVAPLLAVAVVFGWRWFSGAPMWGETAVPVLWPRWQRAMARTVLSVPVVTALWWPQATLAVVAGLTGLVCAVAWHTRRRAAAKAATEAAPIRVQAHIPRRRPPSGALPARPLTTAAAGASQARTATR
ncbi:hypothetical protein [Pilimelia terevasa]|uniref:hypothetical protein n=1 Tax=Pilimelia terevasa TaxID=53372 RepID=UPI001E3BBAC6|nr:hypothetical protein [Pilimelia terevasa]